jgi:hypothetical protein
MISISSGICNKLNYEINITEENNICLYIHDMNYDPDKLKLNVKNPNEYKISMEKRTLAINYIKESSKKSINMIEELELMNLNKLLSSNSIFMNTSTLK